MASESQNTWRKTTQQLMPAHVQRTKPGHYDPFPGFAVSEGTIELGFDALARYIAQSSRVVIDGYVGVFWDDFRKRLDAALAAFGRRAAWVDVREALLPEQDVLRRISPYLGGDDPLFGKRFEGQLCDFFDPDALCNLAQRTTPGGDLTIWYGSGAALAQPEGQLVYVDLPKNELQFRARAGTVTNLGTTQVAPPKPTYKRFYFVDWPALNRHKAALLDRIDLVVDAQRPDEPTLTSGATLRHELDRMAHNYFRVRPWFEPGPWGGQWCRRKIQALPEAPNYAWSFELIVPENGLLLESDGRVLEASFDWLMYRDHHAVLGDCARFFGYEFPIRFDFLDTVEGGNLSVQVHPQPDYIRSHFGELYTQDECYYILDAVPGAEVNLGFQADLDADEFRRTLEHSFEHAEPVAMERFVQQHPAKPHDFFLIPHGTIHGSGAGNLVLEISATPYIFTFKMYDWLRPDLDGKPRPLNIARGMENLNLSRRGQVVKDELLCRPQEIARGEDWSCEHLPTHRNHFYDVYRYNFSSRYASETTGSAHVMSLVSGATVRLRTARGVEQTFNYAETFVVPAAAGSYELISDDGAPLRVVMCRVKPEFATILT